MPREGPVTGRTDAPGRRRLSLGGVGELILGGLRTRSWVWRLSMLWVVTGAGWVVYASVCTLVGCTTNQCTNDEFWFVLWNGEPALVAWAGNWAEMVWPLLAVLVLVAGFVRLRGWRWRNSRRVAAWAGAWAAGIALIVLVAIVAGLGSEAPSVAWGALELPIFAAWLALGAVMTSVLANPPAREQHLPGCR